MPYAFFLNHILFPIPPSKIQMNIGNSNKTVTLINDGEINILKVPGLTEVSFDLLLPNSKYPFARYDDGFKYAKYYLEQIKSMKVNRQPFQLDIYREFPDGRVLFDTNMTVSMEDYTITEEAGNGFDVSVSVKLKEYRQYATKVMSLSQDSYGNTIATVEVPRETTNAPSNTEYTVASGDSLWSIAKSQLGDGLRYTEIYDLNQEQLDNANSKYGGDRYMIYAGQVLLLPT
ncbi:MAG: LysM peptidoglycan-binding domain-containing protein [Clostridia bacterium]|nr:LysM peptidoglycan-binding domain-containing protein [Clostridia bacterium]